MAKVVVDIPYGAFVIDAKDALALAEMVSKAERYQSKYHGASGGTPAHSTSHIYPMNQDAAFIMRLISDDNYRMYKLAGKPED
jgi:hypothetical protein